MVKYHKISGTLFLVTQHFCFHLCQFDQRDEYTADKKYFKVQQWLTSIPTDIPSDAREVWLTFNRITEIQANIFVHLTQCTKLGLSLNQISNVEPGAFNGLTSLRILRLEYNHLQHLHSDMFSHLSNVFFLVIHDNQIQDIEAGTFNGLGNIDHATLEGNLLVKVRADMFQGLEEVRILNIARNVIEFIADDTFSDLKKLTNLRLEGNKLTSLSANVLSQLQRPLGLGLFDPFFDPTHHMMNCDAHLCWLKEEEMQGSIRWLAFTSPVEVTFKPVCAGGLDWDTWTCDGNGMSDCIKN